MDRYAALQKYQDIVTCPHVRSNVRDQRPASAAKRARRRPCGWLALDESTLLKKYHTTKEIKIGISTEIMITIDLCHPYMALRPHERTLRIQTYMFIVSISVFQ